MVTSSHIIVKLIIKKDNDKFYCGGSIIGNNKILTIGPCWRDGWWESFTNNFLFLNI